jgi:hypothetical protein
MVLPNGQIREKYLATTRDAPKDMFLIFDLLIQVVVLEPPHFFEVFACTEDETGLAVWVDEVAPHMHVVG